MDRYVHSFGASLAVSVLLIALVFATKVAFPEFGRWSDEVFGHAWFFMGALALVVFAGLGLSPLRFTAGSRGLAMLMGGALVAAGAVITAAAAWAASG